GGRSGDLGRFHEDFLRSPDKYITAVIPRRVPASVAELGISEIPVPGEEADTPVSRFHLDVRRHAPRNAREIGITAPVPQLGEGPRRASAGEDDVTVRPNRDFF